MGHARGTCARPSLSADIALLRFPPSPLPNPLGQQSGSRDSAAAGTSSLLPPEYWGMSGSGPSVTSAVEALEAQAAGGSLVRKWTLSTAYLSPRSQAAAGRAFRGAVHCGLCSLTGPGSRLARRPGRQLDYISLPPARCREAARREAFASGESPRWPRGEGGVSARAAAVAALERGEARAAARELFRAGNRQGSLDCNAVPASAPGFSPVRPWARGVSVPVDAVSAGGSGRGDGWLGTAGPRRNPPVCSEPSGAAAPARLAARVVFSKPQRGVVLGTEKGTLSQGAGAGRTGWTARLPRGLSFPRCCSWRGADRFRPGVILGTLEASP